jgi:hypothetical protein
MLLAIETLYIATTAFFKVSLGLFFLRLLTRKWERRIIWSLIGVYSVYSFGYVFYATFQCGVPTGDAFWTRKFFHRCGSDAVGLTLGYVHGTLTAGADLIFVILPLPAIYKSFLSRREKQVICGFLMLGSM